MSKQDAKLLVGVATLDNGKFKGLLNFVDSDGNEDEMSSNEEVDTEEEAVAITRSAADRFIKKIKAEHPEVEIEPFKPGE